MDVCDRHPSALAQVQWWHPVGKGRLTLCQHCSDHVHGERLASDGWLPVGLSDLRMGCADPVASPGLRAQA